MNKLKLGPLGVMVAGSLWVAGPATAADGPVQKVTVRTVAHFDFNKTSIRPDDQATLLKEVRATQGVTWQTVRAVGHTDSIGPKTYNEKLAAERAEAAKEFMIGKGVKVDIRTEAQAAAAPIASNNSAQGRARNRRVEIQFDGVRAVPQ